MPNQTTVQHSGAIHMPDGCKVEIGASVGALVDVGAIDGDVSVKLAITKFKKESANAGVIKDMVTKMLAEISFTMLEVYLDNIATLSGGLASVVNTAGTLVSGASQVVASGGWAYKKFIKIEHQNGDGGAITVNSVTGSVDGLLVEDTDYYVGQNSQGQYGVYVLDSVTVTTTSQSLTIDYDYTPNANKTLKCGTSSVELTPKIVRFTHTDENSKKFELTIWSATMSDGFSIVFPAGTSEDMMNVPIVLEGECDTDRTDGEQLFTLIDEQGAA